MTDYDLLCAELDALSEGVPSRISLLANASALLADRLFDLNWAGFYLLEGDRLLLGPFQGKPACIVIPVGKGVCGTAAQSGKTVSVPDVHVFPGHIACDAASRSELVLPVRADGGLYGVLDLDSPVTGRFSESDRAGLERFVSVLEKHLG